MFFTIDPSDPLPIYDQIVRQVKFSVANGAIKPGELLPSVRELAKQLRLNHNTVARAYRELQAQSIVVPIRGTGLEVTQQALRGCRESRLKLIRQRLRNALKEAKRSQLEFSEVQTLIEEELNRAYSETIPK